jgi:hypothetical protein
MPDLMLIVPDPKEADPQALAERRRQKSRRRMALWGAFLVLGLALGTIYATGFASNSGTTDAGGSAGAGAVMGSPGANEDASALANAVTSGSNLQYTWSGRWGSFASNQVMYTVDLTGQTGTYYSEVLLSNTPSGFTDLQLQIRMAGDGGDGCQAADLNTSPTNRVMTFDSSDTQVTYPGLTAAGGPVYCIGVAAANGKDPAGTFIRKASTGATFSGTYPTFVATVNRSS